MPAVLPPPRAPPKPMSSTGQASSISWGPGCGSQCNCCGGFDDASPVSVTWVSQDIAFFLKKNGLGLCHGRLSPQTLAAGPFSAANDPDAHQESGSGPSSSASGMAMVDAGRCHA